MPKEKGSDEPRSKIGLEMRPSLHKRLKVLSVLTDRAMWELTDEAMTQYLDREERHRPLYPLGVVLVGFLRALTPRSAILLRSSAETAASPLGRFAGAEPPFFPISDASRLAGSDLPQWGQIISGSPRIRPPNPEGQAAPNWDRA